MAGHSKWANIKHKKAAVDKKRGKVFTKVLKELTVAAKLGGPDVDSNPRLRLAVALAKKNNMPKDNIERAIKKATDKDSENLAEVTFEGYGPSGVAIFVECTTDNNQRTVANIRSYFSKHGGDLGKDGCLQFVFDRKAIFRLPAEGLDEEEFTLEMIDAGAEDVEFEDGQATVSGAMEEFGNLQKKFEELSLEPEDAGLERIANNYKELDLDTLRKVMKLIDVFEDDDDVQKVYHNVEFNEELMDQL